MLLLGNLSCIALDAQTLPTSEAAAIEYLSAKGVQIKQDDQGHAVALMSSGKPPMTAAEYQLIGLLTQLERIGINGAPLSDAEWGFLKSLPQLKTLSIWHGAKFATLKPFSGLPVESLTIGGCMGLRDLNKGDPERLRNAVTTLDDLPKLQRLSLYHSPLSPDDAHLKHIAQQFPTVEDLRVDFAAPRGSTTTITAEGLRTLQQLPLRVLTIENARSFTDQHYAAIATIKSLRSLLIDARKQALPTEPIESFRQRRPDVEVVVAEPGAKGPPQAKRRK
jgi:hypothetical protein